jgi:hypothetical protein
MSKEAALISPPSVAGKCTLHLGHSSSEMVYFIYGLFRNHSSCAPEMATIIKLWSFGTHLHTLAKQAVPLTLGEAKRGSGLIQY